MQPSMVWVDELQLVEAGPAYPAEPPYLSENFEGNGLNGWLLTEPGADWSASAPDDADVYNPHVVANQPHGGKKCLKMAGNWGMLDRPFAESITDCVVTAWFRDVPTRKKSGRMIMLVGKGNRRAGIGTHKESSSHFAAFLGHKVKISGVPRDSEWHEAKWEVIEGKGVKCYIDGNLVGEIDSLDAFHSIRLGQGFWGASTFYIDDIQIDR